MRIIIVRSLHTSDIHGAISINAPGQNDRYFRPVYSSVGPRRVLVVSITPLYRRVQRACTERHLMRSVFLFE